MTKSARIFDLYKRFPGMTTRQIADAVGCGTSYVRVVTRQRKGKGTSAIDRRYLMKRYGASTASEAWCLQGREWRARRRQAAASQ